MLDSPYDPIKDYDSYLTDQEQERELKPVCSNCDRVITEDYMYVIDDKVYCDECIDDLFREDVPDYESYYYED